MKFLIATDAHGNAGLRDAEQWALSEDCDAMIITGDVWSIDKDRALPTHVIRGNHEQAKLWQRWRAKGWVGKNVHPHEDYSTFELGGMSFGCLGRMNAEDYDRMTASGWWLGEPEIAIFHENLPRAIEIFQECQTLLFHDAPFPFPLRNDRSGSHFLADIVHKLNPRSVFHGHMHVHYERNDGETRIYGLAPCDPEFTERSYALLNTSTGEVAVHRIASNQKASL